MKPGFDAKLETFLDGVQKLCDAADIDATLHVMPGPKYLRIVKEWGGQQSVYCFIERATGDVLKAESWRKPAKHARGNIFDESNGLARCKWTGPEYLR